MSFPEAKKCFEDNYRYINAQSHPVEYNLTGGLLSLTEALEAKIAFLEMRLADVETLLRQLHSK